jgi:hypothetical protein
MVGPTAEDCRRRRRYRGRLGRIPFCESSEFPLGEFADQTDAFVLGLSCFSRPAEFAAGKFEAVVIYDSLVEDACSELERRNEFGIGPDLDQFD